jgi:hypothetical protein
MKRQETHHVHFGRFDSLAQYYQIEQHPYDRPISRIICFLNQIDPIVFDKWVGVQPSQNSPIIWIRALHNCTRTVQQATGLAHHVKLKPMEQNYSTTLPFTVQGTWYPTCDSPSEERSLLLVPSHNHPASWQACNGPRPALPLHLCPVRAFIYRTSWRPCHSIAPSWSRPLPHYFIRGEVWQETPRGTGWLSRLGSRERRREGDTWFLSSSVTDASHDQNPGNGKSRSSARRAKRCYSPLFLGFLRCARGEPWRRRQPARRRPR